MRSGRNEDGEDSDVIWGIIMAFAYV